MGAKLTFPVIILPRERVYIVTGGNTGLGYVTAKTIAMIGATVIIACRSEERATKAIAKMNEEYAKEKAQEQETAVASTLPVEFMKLDLASLKSTMEFIESFKATGRDLHCFICNAGIGMAPKSITEDGYESMFQTNYLGHFLILAHLLPIMKRSGPDCRVILVSSVAHQFAQFNLKTAQAEEGAAFDRLVYYGNSKLYQIMKMYSISRRLKGLNVTITSLHPGIVDTGLIRNFHGYKASYLYYFMNAFGLSKSPTQGAETIINCAINPDLTNVSDVYFDSCRPKTPTKVARNEEYQEALWKYTLKCLENHITGNILECLEGRD